MHEITKQKKIFAVLLPVMLLLGVVLLIATSIGSVLNAALEVPFVHLKNEKGKLLEKIETKNELATFQLIANEDEIFEVKYDASFSVLPLNEKKEELSSPIYHKENLPTDNVEDIFKNLTEEAEEFYDGKNSEVKVTCIQIMETDSKGAFYFNLKKDQNQYLKISRNTTESIKVNVSSSKDPDCAQQIIYFKPLEEALDDSSYLERSTVSQQSNQEENNKKETVKNKEVFEEKPTEKEEIDSDTGSQTIDSESTKKNTKVEDVVDVEKKHNASNSNSSEKEYSQESLPDLGTPESYERILAVETKKTKDSLNDLLKSTYEPEDSLKKPQYITDATTNKLTSKENSSNSPIIIRGVNLTVKTGTSSFDNDNVPGHDKDEDNNIVRSFDRVSYLVSFSIQNTSMSKKYTNIRYRVIANLDDAVEIVNDVPRNNAEISNGTYVDKDDNSGSQYSEGVMESVISDTGQVFVPIIMNVYASPNGKKLNPTIKLEIVDALNVETDEIENINKSYDSSELSKLLIPETTVSAKPSIGVKLVAGEIKNSNLFGWSSPSCKGYDVGIVTSLKSLPERKTGDYKGSTFPTGEIKYNIKQKGTYQIGADPAQNLIINQHNPFTLAAYAPAINDRSSADWTNIYSVDTNKLDRTLDVPNAKTKKIFTSQPLGDLSKIGVYDAGDYTATTNTSTYMSNISNSNYAQTINPYTYSMTGNRMQSTDGYSFSSCELVFFWESDKSNSIAKANGWTRYDMTLYIDSVSYDGMTTANDSSISYPTIVDVPGNFAGGPIFAKSTTNDENNITNLGLNHPRLETNTGNARLNQGDEIYLHSFNLTSNLKTQQTKAILMWDPSGFEFDSSRRVFIDEFGHPYFSSTYKYGVAKNITQTAPYTMNIGSYTTTRSLYYWFDTPKEATDAGEISAVETINDLDMPKIRGNVYHLPYIPVKVLASPGSKTPKGNPIVVMLSSQFNDAEGNLLSGVTGKYNPTQYDSNGNVTNIPEKYWNWFGESGYVVPFNVTTLTDVKKSLYEADEEIEIKVNGVYKGSSSVKYDSALNTTLPKGIHYKLGTSKDALGNALTDPVVTENPDGTCTLRWIFTDISLNNGTEVNFSATSDFTKLPFKDTGYTEDLKVVTKGEIWISGNPDNRDESHESLRTSTDVFIEKLIQQIILSKEANKPFIEVGDKDPVEGDTSITYKIKMVNESASSSINARILDVLPYDGDSRGTKLSGTHEVEDIKVSDTKAEITFTNLKTNESDDPNNILGWTSYKPGVSDISIVKNAKAFLVTYPILESGESIEVTIKIRPKNQKAGDVLVNNAAMNSDLNLPVNSQAVWTSVYGRDLSGVAWYDDNLDGLIGNKPSGGAEEKVKDIPVKLYRTSLEVPSYKNKLVEESLTGEKFIDSSGNSLVKTDTNGKYQFNNLPEGNYLAEFVIGDKVVQREFRVTKKEAGSDESLNSKADQTTYKTKDFAQPILSEVAGLGATDSKNHVEHVNLGLVRPSTIRLFKFATGTAIDGDGDGKLSEAEKATGTPLKNAEFEVYEGDASSPFAKETTDDSGNLSFVKLFPGEHTLIETKAPEGYELIKSPIKVTITEGNQTIQVYQEDDKKTDLPFTGGTGPMLLLLIIVSGMGILGLGGLYWYYRQPSRKGEG